MNFLLSFFPPKPNLSLDFPFPEEDWFWYELRKCVLQKFIERVGVPRGIPQLSGKSGGKKDGRHSDTIQWHRGTVEVQARE